VFLLVVVVVVVVAYTLVVELLVSGGPWRWSIFDGESTGLQKTN
jgi:hypothetical protein